MTNQDVSTEDTSAAAQVEKDRALLQEAAQKGPMATFWTYIRLSGPGWLQSAITLGGGSLAGSLYLGVLAGYGMMWWQPMAMIMGVIMLSAIGYVTLSTGERPFQSIKKHINPVLAWGWVIATVMANMVWCMPQFGLGVAAIRQNLAPEYLGAAAAETEMSTIDAANTDATGEQSTLEERKALKADIEFRQNLTCVIALLFMAGTIVWFYDSGGWGIKVFEFVLKAMVAVVVISFFGVVFALSGKLNWGEILAGFIPQPGLFFEPAAGFAKPLAATGEFAAYWREVIVNNQQQVMITAAATAVGINMTFLLPYSMLAKGWNKEFRGLAIFDLSTGLFIPYLLATSCVVIAAIHSFHAAPAPGYGGAKGEPAENLRGGYEKLLDARIKNELGDEKFAALDDAAIKQRRDALPAADKQLAAMLVQRDAGNLAQSLQPLVGDTISRYVFGIGVLGMAVSTIIILMLINGFAVCEMLNVAAKGTPRRLGALMAGCVGALGPFLWKGDAKFWLAVPTSVFGMMLLPIAYVTFFCMMNSKSLLGDAMPTGRARIIWNVLMGIATTIASALCLWAIYINPAPTEKYLGIKAAPLGFGVLAVFIAVAAVAHFMRKPESTETGAAN
ncbi:MAG: divalent metal cation transporter [Planctomycetaceae bacterium]